MKNRLIDLAVSNMKNAYVPYSNFRVGAAVECDSGKIYEGCNIENASYGLTVCAERVAILKAISEGEKKIKKIAVAASSKKTSIPCGACLQVINEFGEGVKIYCCGVDGSYDTYNMESLFPFHTRNNQLKDCLKRQKNK